MIRLPIKPEEVAVLRYALDHALSSISEAHPDDRAQLQALIEQLEAASAPIGTQNVDWGFHGTLVLRGIDLPAQRFEEAARELVTRLGITADEARDVLDAPVGRHLADDIDLRESGADLIARWMGDRKCARRIREAAARVKGGRS